MYSIAGRVELELWPDAVDRVVGGISRETAQRGADAAVQRAKANAPVDSGELRNSIHAESPHSVGNMFYVVNVVADADHALYQELGTRAHGPVAAKHLVFKPKGSNTYVFAKWVRGVPPVRYLGRALDSLSTGDFT